MHQTARHSGFQYPSDIQKKIEAACWAFDHGRHDTFNHRHFDRIDPAVIHSFRCRWQGAGGSKGSVEKERFKVEKELEGQEETGPGLGLGRRRLGLVV